MFIITFTMFSLLTVTLLCSSRKSRGIKNSNKRVLLDEKSPQRTGLSYNLTYNLQNLCEYTESFSFVLSKELFYFPNRQQGEHASSGDEYLNLKSALLKGDKVLDSIRKDLNRIGIRSQVGASNVLIHVLASQIVQGNLSFKESSLSGSLLESQLPSSTSAADYSLKYVWMGIIDDHYAIKAPWTFFLEHVEEVVVNKLLSSKDELEIDYQQRECILALILGHMYGLCVAIDNDDNSDAWGSTDITRMHLVILLSAMELKLRTNAENGFNEPSMLTSLKSFYQFLAHKEVMCIPMSWKADNCLKNLYLELDEISSSLPPESSLFPLLKDKRSLRIDDLEKDPQLMADYQPYLKRVLAIARYGDRGVHVSSCYSEGFRWISRDKKSSQISGGHESDGKSIIKKCFCKKRNRKLLASFTIYTSSALLLALFSKYIFDHGKLLTL